MKGERVLIDTSVWIDYLRKGSGRLSEKVDEILNMSEVSVPRVVIAELFQGAKSEKEVSVITDFMEAFRIIDQSENTWIKAGRLSFRMKRKGITVPIVDCYISVIASEQGCKIFSLDKHFQVIKRYSDIGLIA